MRRISKTTHTLSPVRSHIFSPACFIALSFASSIAVSLSLHHCNSTNIRNRKQDSERQSPRHIVKLHDGRKAALYADGTWLYILPGRNVGTSTSKAKYEIRYDPSTWKPYPRRLHPRADHSIVHRDGKVYAILIHERIRLSLPELRKAALNRLRKIATNIQMLHEERRTVNGKMILYMRFNARVRGIDFSYVGRYYAGPEGSIQFIAFTGSSLYQKYAQEIDKLLNGLVIGS